MKYKSIGAALALVLMASGCADVKATRDSVAHDVDSFKLFPSTRVAYRERADGFDPKLQPPTDPTRVLVTRGDDVGRPYRVIGEITTSITKAALFEPSPTIEAVDRRLRREAALIGADAVVNANYGHFGIEMVEWGSLEGQGLAVRYGE